MAEAPDADRVSADPLKPGYHFTAPTNWLNDPNGLIWHAGNYHLLYQYANDPRWEIKQWGHAVSQDLVHWRDLPVALSPTPGSPDREGCWSGVAVDDGGTVTLIYSGFSGDPFPQYPCSATATGPDLVAFRKNQRNPIIPAPPAGLDLLTFRDHCVWREGDEWRMLIGSGLRGEGGTALLYGSRDLEEWEYLHPLAVGDAKASEPIWTGTVWECPDFFPLGERQALLLAVMDEDARDETAFMGYAHHSVYLTGSYESGRFSYDAGGRLDWGDFYAAQTMLTPDGRRVAFGWLWEAKPFAAQRAAGWSGAMSLPRVLTLAEGGRLRQAPAPELQALRRGPFDAGALDLQAGCTWSAPELAGKAIEIELIARLADGAGLGLSLLATPDGREVTALRYADGRLTIDRTRSSLDGTTYGHPVTCPLPLAPGEPLRLRVFVDRSVVEVFANDRECLTARIYPTLPNSHGVSVTANGGQARVESLRAWQMSGVWEESGANP